MASTPALIGPKSCEGASPFRALREQRRVEEGGGEGGTPSLDFISSLKSTLRLREINEHPFSTITRDPGIAHALHVHARITFGVF